MSRIEVGGGGGAGGGGGSGTSSSLVWHGPIVVNHTDITTVQAAQHQKWQVQIVGSPTGGTFTLAPFEDTTSPSNPIAFDADAAAVQAALDVANSGWAGQVTVTGTSPTFVVEFLDGGPAGYVGKVPMDVLDNSLTGGTSAHVTLTETQVGRPLLVGCQVFDPDAGDIVVGAMLHVTETFDGGSVSARFFSMSDYDSLSTTYGLTDLATAFNSAPNFGGDDAPVVLLVSAAGNIGGTALVHTRGSVTCYIATATPTPV